MDYKEGDKGTSGRWGDSWRYAKISTWASLKILGLTEDCIDFEKTFIQCIVYNYEILKELEDEAEVKAKGKVMTKGKDYVVEYVNKTTTPYKANVRAETVTLY